LENARLASTVFVSWSGDDPDGFVSAFELRVFDARLSPDANAGWTTTTRYDSLILLPIPAGDESADVRVEVRSIDNQGLRDPSPARTVFPIKNSPPVIALKTADLTPDTTFAVFSFGWSVFDPEGPANLDRIEVSLNDSLEFVSLSPEFDFATFVGDVAKDDPGQFETDAVVFSGRSFQTTGVRVPGLRLGAENTLFVRAVDKTDTTSAVAVHSWFVKKSRGDVLYVNDYRKSTFVTLQRFHLGLLRDFLPADAEVDIWDISIPFATGATGNTPRSSLLPPNRDPTLRHALADYKYIYWVSTNTTSSIAADNFPFAATALDLFFDEGGRMMVHSPVAIPDDPDDLLGNPALLVLPLTNLVTVPDSLRAQLRMRNGAPIEPVELVPGTGVSLPALELSSFLIALPFDASGSSIIPLLRGQFTSTSRDGRRQYTWEGPSTIASMSIDRRIGLFALPLINETSGDLVLRGSDGSSDAPLRAVKMMLQGLEFPSR
jgi:hypothetical protein